MKTQTTAGSVVILAALLAAAALTTAGCSGGGGESGPTAVVLDISEIEFQSLSLVNDARVTEGVEILGTDGGVAVVARRHSEAMRHQGFFGHDNPATGQGLRQRLRAAGVSFTAAAENLVQVNRAGNPAGVAHSELMASATHRENILSARFELAGIGVARAGDTFWISQIFIRP